MLLKKMLEARVGRNICFLMHLTPHPYHASRTRLPAVLATCDHLPY